ncbi:MAG: ATP-binding protein [Candidatus Marinimicrobia bacterium]|nr:ATP-binding protein [Candidatus Neomarinimicrobiota bacterium]
MIPRDLRSELLQSASEMPVVSINGPRQSGKTTLVKATFPDFDYLNLENHDTQLFAREDPRGLLAQYARGVIIDEAQNAPELFSYLQVQVDQEKSSGPYILTGSQNFLLHEKISQTLAGRVALQVLLPLSMAELSSTAYAESHYETYLYKGFYPRIYDRNLDPGKWLASYIQTYVERDVRKMVNIGDLSQFQAFIRLCAGRIGQLLNLSSLGNELGVSYQTIKRWISVLEASYIIFRLPPYYKSFNKRVLKTTKLYFYDPGLAAFLLGIHSADQVQNHYLKGELFEGLIISEIKKQLFQHGQAASIYYWRDRSGHEVDCIVDAGGQQIAIEIKSGRTIREDMFKGLRYWRQLSGAEPQDTFLVYGGDENQHRRIATVCSWKNSIEAIHP